LGFANAHHQPTKNKNAKLIRTHSFHTPSEKMQPNSREREDVAVKIWSITLEATLLGAICLLFAGSVSVAEIIVAIFAGALAASWHARLLHHSHFRFVGKPQPLHILKLSAKGALRDVPQGGWHVLTSLWSGHYGKQVMEPAPMLIDDTNMHAIPKRRALAILITSFGPLAYTMEAHREALRVHRALGTRRSE
jgi:hypothetical protein